MHVSVCVIWFMLCAFQWRVSSGIIPASDEGKQNTKADGKEELPSNL